MSNCYDKRLRDIAMKQAEKLDMKFMQEGVYVVQTGPCYETVSECRMLRAMGADVTGKIIVKITSL